MPQFYSDTVLVPVGYVALAIAVVRGFDAITDPLMGWLSDRTRSRWGRRKPWIVAGVPLGALSFWALLAPPESMTPGLAALWFALMFGAYYVLNTIYEVPYGGLGYELSDDYHERSSLFGWRSFFIATGTIAASILPKLLEEIGIGGRRESFALIGWLCAGLLVFLYGVMLVKVKERASYQDRKWNPLVPGVRRAFRNRPFRLLLTAYVIYAIPSLMPALLMPYFVFYVLRPENAWGWLSIFLVIYLGSGTLFLPMWIRLAKRFGKLRVWMICGLIGVFGGASLLLPRQGDTTLYAVLLFIVGAQYGAFLFLAPAMQADIIDYDELHSGLRREAQYGALWQIVPKFVAVPGASIPIAIMGAMGYVPNRVQTPTVELTIRVLYALVPACFNLLALLVIMRYPVTEEVHRKIREGIAQHEAGANAVDPLTGRTLLPPRAGAVAEDTSWFLDHFSRSELLAYLKRGARELVSRSALWMLVSALVSAGSTVFVLEVIRDGQRDPGPAAVVAVVLAGFSLSAAIYHAIRLRAARRMKLEPIASDTVQAHLQAQSG
jgi:GPH family glycoside/pentoside/hexuronide:cation symporter